MDDDKWKVSPKFWKTLKPLARQNRHQPTPAEKILWAQLRNRQLNGLKFRRQHAVGHYIVDFYCADAWLVIEIDGTSHDKTKLEDQERQAFLEAARLRVLRFRNEDVLSRIEAVLAQITSAARTSPSLKVGEGAGG